jgi:hypothetical protein
LVNIDRDGSQKTPESRMTDRGVSRIILPLVACGGLAVSIGGCQPEDGPVRLAVYGTVTCASGDPVSGMISFLPESGNAGPAATASLIDGVYNFDTKNGPVAGQYRVVVVKQAPERRHKSAAGPDSKGPAAGAVPVDDASMAAEEWSFTAEVSAEDVEFDFELPDEAAANTSG